MGKSINWWWSDKWTPIKLGSKLKLWLDAKDSSTITHVAGAVSKWADKSGNNNDFIQNVASAKPTYDLIDKITFDGIANFLESTPFLNAVKSDLKGEIFVIHAKTNDAKNSFTFALSNDSTANYVFVDIASNVAGTAPDKSRLLRNSSVPGVDGISGNVHDLEYVINSFSTDGLIWQLFENNVDVGVDINTNNGDWFGDLGVTPTKAYIGKIAPGSFGAVGVKAVLYINDQLTSDERTNLFNYLNGLFSVY